MTRDFQKLERVLSKQRFDSYKKPGHTEHESFSLYVWNTMLCESLYAPFQILEVGARNAIHSEIAVAIKQPEWLNIEHGFLHEDEKEAIKEAKQALAKRRSPCGEPELVAEMSFGFWTSLIDSRYETLWHKIIIGVFPHMPKHIRTRGEISKRMNAARKIRNAAFHHHSIWHWKDLKDQHFELRNLIRWICPSIDEMAFRIDRFPRIYRLGAKESTRILGDEWDYSI